MHRAMLAEPACISPEVRSVENATLTAKFPSFWNEPYAERSKADYLWDVARDCLEDLSGLRGQRRPRLREHWRELQLVEHRLLAQIDAVIACGPSAWREAINSLQEAEIPDPDMVFAVALVLGCLSGEEPVRSVADLLLLCEARDPEEVAALIEAIRLAPNPGVKAALNPLLEHERAGVRGAAASILGARCELDARQTGTMIHAEEPQVVCAAIRCAYNLRHSRALNELPRLLTHRYESVVRAALRVATGLSLPEGRRRALDLCGQGRGDFAGSALFVALWGDREDAPVLDRLLADQPGKASVRAAGYLGFIQAIAPLISLLRNSEDKAIVRGAASALERITGARVEQPESAKPGNPGASQPPCVDPDRWEFWWSINLKRFSPSVRYRRGRAFGAYVLFWEIDEAPLSSAERAIAHLELSRLADEPAPLFRPDDFIIRQQRALAEWEKRLCARSLNRKPEHARA